MLQKLFQISKGTQNPFYLESDEVFPDKYLIESTEERLKFLSVNQIDILLLHTWSSRWNDNPQPLKVLQKLKEQGLIKNIGVSIPTHDISSIKEIIKRDLIDVIELPYNIFDQNVAASLLATAKKHNVGVIARQPFDEGILTGKFNPNSTFPENDFRNLYFSGDRLIRSCKRVDDIKKDLEGTDYSLAQAALLFVLNSSTVSTVIPGMRNPWHIEANTAVSDMKPLSNELIEKLRSHWWIKSFWIKSVLDKTFKEENIG